MSETPSTALRDQAWLGELLDATWDAHFVDVPQTNPVRILFGRKARTRLGSIKVDPREPDVSIITMNGLFKLQEIPEFVVLATLVHELTHYAHGFNSPLDQKHRHPHAGGVMRAEYRERGLEQLYLDQRKWLKEYWPGIIRAHFTPARRAQPRARTQIVRSVIPKPFWM